MQNWILYRLRYGRSFYDEYLRCNSQFSNAIILRSFIGLSCMISSCKATPTRIYQPSPLIPFPRTSLPRLLHYRRHKSVFFLLLNLDFHSNYNVQVHVGKMARCVNSLVIGESPSLRDLLCTTNGIWNGHRTCRTRECSGIGSLRNHDYCALGWGMGCEIYFKATYVDISRSGLFPHQNFIKKQPR